MQSTSNEVAKKNTFKNVKVYRKDMKTLDKVQPPPFQNDAKLASLE